MDKILVSLISDQAVPNIAFIKNFKPFDRYVFVSSERMEKKHIVDNLLKAMDISETLVDRIIVDAESLEDIKAKLESHHFDFKNCEYLVNVTGGTKMMSLGAFNYFKSNGCKIYYFGVESNGFKQISPNYEDASDKDNLINLEEYLTSYGIKFSSSSKLKSLNENIRFKDEVFDNNKKYITELRKLRNGDFKDDKQKKKIYNRLDGGKAVQITELDEPLAQLIKLSGFDKASISKKDIAYITGGWFEEYVYNNLLQNISPENIKLSLNVKNINNITSIDNELDVVFIHKNQLHIIECKTGLNSEYGSIFSNTIYKQASLRKEFGLTAKSHLFVYDDINLDSDPKRAESDRQRVESNKQRAEVHGINLVERNKLDSCSNIFDILFSS